MQKDYTNTQSTKACMHFENKPHLMFKKMKTHKSNLRTGGQNGHQCLHLSKPTYND